MLGVTCFCFARVGHIFPFVLPQKKNPSDIFGEIELHNEVKQVYDFTYRRLKN